MWVKFLKSLVDPAVKELLALKAEFKSLTGLDWSPSIAIPKQEVNTEVNSMSSLAEVDGQIKACGDRVRSLKAQKAEKVNSYSSIVTFGLSIDWLCRL